MFKFPRGRLCLKVGLFLTCSMKSRFFIKCKWRDRVEIYWAFKLDLNTLRQLIYQDLYSPKVLGYSVVFLDVLYVFPGVGRWQNADVNKSGTSRAWLGKASLMHSIKTSKTPKSDPQIGENNSVFSNTKPLITTLSMYPCQYVLL